MRYWWVNHKQTFKEETEGKFIWAPKTQKGGKHSHFYDNMPKVDQGDLVFSYANGHICGFGPASSLARSEARPAIFERTGEQWEEDGWRVDVNFHIFPENQRFRPKDRIVEILEREFLPEKYSPLNDQGGGNQGAYLSEISEDFADYLLEQLALAGNRVSVEEIAGSARSAEIQEARSELEIIRDPQLTETERLNLVASRVGQGIFRKNVLRLHPTCLLTGIDNPDFLIASHIKPWRLCDNRERLDPHNGLMLTPNADRLFDRGLISFSDEGVLLISDKLPPGILNQLGIPNRKVLEFTEKQALYLAFHRSYYKFKT